MRTRVLLIAATLWCVGVGCDDMPAVRLVSPTAGSAVTWMPQTLQLDFIADADPGSLFVTLNGSEISAQFVLGPAQGGRIVAIASGVWGGVVAPGSNALFARVTRGGQTFSIAPTLIAEGDPYADSVLAFVAGAGAGFGQSLLPGIALGPPNGGGLFNGSLSTVALGLGGRIDLAFTNNVIVNGSGVDFTLFENAFLRLQAGFVTGVPFAEPARVSVSQDGVAWYAFPCTLAIGAGPYWPGCAGIYPVLADAANPASVHASIPTSTPIQALVGVDAFALTAPAGAGGDSFDLALVGLAWARYVRIEAAGFVSGPVGADNAGFDLDGAAAVHSVPATDANANGIPDAVE